MHTESLEKDLQEADKEKHRMYKIYHEIALINLFPRIESLKESF